MEMRSPHEELVATLARTPLGPASIDRLAARMRAPIDWNNVLATAAAWDVEPVVLSNLRSHFFAAMPNDVLLRVELRERETRAWSLAQSLMVAELAQQLENAGIPVIVLKGPAVSLLAYGDASLRTFSDIDLLIRSADIPAARQFLLDDGYERGYAIDLESHLIRHGHGLGFGNGRNTIDLHEVLFPRHLRLDLDSSGVWENAISITCGSGRFRSLSRPHLFLFLCAHGAKHMWARERWIADIANFVERLSGDDISRVVELANRSHSRRILSIALHLAHRMHGKDLAHFPREAIDPDEPPFTPRVRPGADPNLSHLRYWASTRERLIDRIGSYASVLFVPTEKDRGPGPIPWLHRPLRVGLNIVRRAIA